MSNQHELAKYEYWNVGFVPVSIPKTIVYDDDTVIEAGSIGRGRPQDAWDIEDDDWDVVIDDVMYDLRRDEIEIRK